MGSRCLTDSLSSMNKSDSNTEKGLLITSMFMIKDAPTDEILQAIAEAAIQAPSGMNRQAWRVIVVKDKKLIQEMESEGMSHIANMEDKSSYDRIMERGGRLFYGAPCMIVVPIDPAQYAPALIDCGILCQNIALAATSLGIANIMQYDIQNLILTMNR